MGMEGHRWFNQETLINTTRIVTLLYESGRARRPQFPSCGLRAFSYSRVTIPSVTIPVINTNEDIVTLPASNTNGV